MVAVRPHWTARPKALAIDWLIWAYIPAAIAYYFRDTLSDQPYAMWVYLACIPVGLVVALILQGRGTTIGERLMGSEPAEAATAAGEPGAEARPAGAVATPPRRPWYRTQVGVTSLILAVVTFVLGWNITDINLYYVFTRADRMANMTDRLLRPYWPVFGRLVEGMIETIFLALMSTVISVPIAALLSFFAARNLMQRVTTPYGSLVGGFVLAVLGVALGQRLGGWLVLPLANTNLDIPLISGILTTVLVVVGLVAGFALGLRLMRAALASSRGGAPRLLTSLLTGVLGVMLAYLLAALVSMVVFAGSWAIFVRDFGPWPWVVLAVGLVAGLILGWRQSPRAEFPVGGLIYGVMRFFMNITRSIEPFVWALIFVTWFRLGPFPGMVALMVHSIAALGKLYSEQIEGIDPGPLEAVRATGANELQTVVYAVVPQIIPPFISFTIYRWDINVRMSTIIGLVGGGGIGQLLFQYQNLGQWRSVSVTVILIVAVVMVLDTISARIRERIV